MAAMAREIFHPVFFANGSFRSLRSFRSSKAEAPQRQTAVQNDAHRKKNQFQLTILRNKIKIFMAFKVKRKKRIKKIERWSFLGSEN